MKRILITGAAGLVGRAVTEAAQSRGWSVRAWTHRHINLDVPVIVGDLQNVALADEATRDIDVVVHLAARKRDEEDSEDVNVDGTRILAEAARRNGVHTFIYVSTQSVRLSERGVYAETKLKGEDAARSAFPDTTVVRPSILYGDELDDLLMTLSRVSSLPVIPVFGSGGAVFRPMHVADFADALINMAVEEGVRGSTLDAGGTEEITFDAFLKLFQSLHKKRGPILHLPLWLGLLIARLPGSPITKSNVRGGAEVLPMDIDEWKRFIKTDSRMLKAGIMNAVKETERTNEARTLLRYVGATVKKELVDRYEDACRAHHVEKRLHLSLLLPLQDAWTRLYAPDALLRKKLLIAAAVYECDPASAPDLLPQHQSRIFVLLQAILIGLKSLVLIVLAQILFLFPSRIRRGA